jgi:Zn-dependent M28 family amino/carboxypeptidase
MNKNAGPIIIFAAHFDSRAIAEKDANYNTLPTPGANDGAGSVAIVIELMKVISENLTDLDYEIWGVFFDAEDQGAGAIANWNYIEGSIKMVDDMVANPTFFFGSGRSIANIEKMILFDMVCGKNLKLIYEGNSDYSLLNSIFIAGRELGYTSAFPSSGNQYKIIDDHLPFANKGIPTADLIIKFWDDSGWPHHHTRQDTIDNIDIDSIRIIGTTMEYWFTRFYSKTYGEIPKYPEPSTVGFSNWFFIICVGSISIAMIYHLNKKKIKHFYQL